MADSDHAARGRYVEELHVSLVVALVVISVALGIAGWALHPESAGFQPVPQDLRILVAGSGFDGAETLAQSGDDAATLTVSTSVAGAFVPLRDSDAFTTLAGPQAAGAASVVRGPAVTFDGKPLASSRWAYIVLNPGRALPCSGHSGYRSGRVALPLGGAEPALVVPPQRPQTSVGGTVSPPGLCVHWEAAAPLSLRGPYLTVRFPPLRGVSRDVPFTQIPQTGDLGVESITRVLTLNGGNTTDFAIQTEPQPTLSAPLSWTWTSKDSPQVIQLAATNSSESQRENTNAFYSGVLFGVVGGALIALVTELVVPLRRRRS
jgi:hypothetical protein